MKDREVEPAEPRDQNPVHKVVGYGALATFLNTDCLANHKGPKGKWSLGASLQFNFRCAGG